MDDNAIVELYWNRDAEAIHETDRKYGAYCLSVSRNILKDIEDAQECVNDTYLNAWNAIPPTRPKSLPAFLGRLTRNLSFNRYKLSAAKKRGGGEVPLVLEELSEIVSGADTESEIDRRELMRVINVFLGELTEDKRDIFVLRYWYAESVSDIAKSRGLSESGVSMTLSRLRKKLRARLLEGGFEL